MKIALFVFMVCAAACCARAYVLTCDPRGGNLGSRDGNFGDKMGKSQEATVNVSKGSPAYYYLGTAEKKGAKFLGWFTRPSGGEKVYDSSGACVNGGKYWEGNRWQYDGDLKIYAQYEGDAKENGKKTASKSVAKGKTSGSGLQIKYYHIGSQDEYNQSPYKSTDYNEIQKYVKSREPDLVEETSSIGPTLDFPESKFHGEFNQRATDWFLAVMSGKIKISKSGEYEFGSKADDYCRIFIDKKYVQTTGGGWRRYARNGSSYDVVVDYNSGKVKLSAGYHDITVLFSDLWGPHFFSLYMKAPGADDKELLPQSMLSYGKLKGPGASAATAVGDDSYKTLSADDKKYMSILTKKEVQSRKQKKITSAQYADAIVALAENEDRAPVQFALKKDAFDSYARSGEVAKAAKLYSSTLQEMGLEYALALASKVQIPPAGQKLKATIAADRQRCEKINILKGKIARDSENKSLYEQLGLEYAVVGEWGRALDSFLKAEGDVAKVAEWENGKDSSMSLMDAGSFWWGYAEGKNKAKQAAICLHAAKVYKEAIDQGGLSANEERMAQNCIDEAKAYGKQ